MQMCFLKSFLGKKTTQGMKNEALLIANKHNNGMSGVIYSLSFFSRRLTTHPLSKTQCDCSTKCADVTWVKMKQSFWLNSKCAMNDQTKNW